MTSWTDDDTYNAAMFGEFTRTGNLIMPDARCKVEMVSGKYWVSVRTKDGREIPGMWREFDSRNDAKAYVDKIMPQDKEDE